MPIYDLRVTRVEGLSSDDPGSYLDVYLPIVMLSQHH